MKRFLGCIFVITFFLLIVEGALPQMQMVLLAGNILIKSILLKVVLLLLVATFFVLHVLKSSTVIWPKSLSVTYFIFIAYLIVHFILLREEYPADYLLQSYNSYYFFLLLFPFVSLVSVDAKFFGKLLIVISIPLLLLGFAQYLSNSPILPVTSADEYFKVYSVEYYGKTRAFSLFNSGINYGHFLSLLGAFVLCHMIKARRFTRFFLALVLAGVAFACYTTLTRNLYIEFVFTLLAAALLMQRQKFKPSSVRYRLMTAVPFIYGIMASIIIFVVPLFDFVSGSESLLLKQDSLLIRLQAWLYYLPLWIDAGLKTLLFGVGLIQHEKFPITENVVIDNSFLAIGLHIGIFGLILWIVLMWKLWKYLMEIQGKLPGNIPIAAMTALCSTWMSSGLFNNNFNLYAILFIMIFPLYISEKSKLKTVREPCVYGSPGQTKSVDHVCPAGECGGAT